MSNQYLIKLYVILVLPSTDHQSVIIFDHLSASGKSDPAVWTRWVPAPECFHPEHDIWRNRSPYGGGVLHGRGWLKDIKGPMGKHLFFETDHGRSSKSRVCIFVGVKLHFQALLGEYFYGFWHFLTPWLPALVAGLRGLNAKFHFAAIKWEKYG